MRFSAATFSGWTTRLAVGFFAVGVAVTLALSTANASSLPLSAGSASVSVAQGCSTAPVTVTRTQPVYFVWWLPYFWAQAGWEGVQLSNIPAACRNLPIQVTAGEGETSAVVPAGATSATLSVTMNGQYERDTSSFALTVNGWHVPTVAP